MYTIPLNLFSADNKNKIAFRKKTRRNITLFIYFNIKTGIQSRVHNT